MSARPSRCLSVARAIDVGMPRRADADHRASRSSPAATSRIWSTERLGRATIARNRGPAVRSLETKPARTTASLVHPPQSPSCSRGDAGTASLALHWNQTPKATGAFPAAWRPRVREYVRRSRLLGKTRVRNGSVSWARSQTWRESCSNEARRPVHTAKALRVRRKKRRIGCDGSEADRKYRGAAAKSKVGTRIHVFRTLSSPGVWARPETRRLDVERLGAGDLDWYRKRRDR